MYAAGHLENLVGAEVELGEDVLSALDDGGEARVVDDHRVEALDVQRALPCRRHREEVRLRLFSLEEGTQHANRLTAVIVRGVDARCAHPHVLRGLLDSLSRRDEDRDAALLLVDPLQELVVEELAHVLADDFDLRRLRGIERVHLEHVGALEVAAIERRVDGRGQPDEAAADALPQRQAQLELRRRLVDLVDDERVAGKNVAVLEPAARDAGGDDDDVPTWRVGCRFALPIDDADAEVGRSEQLLGDRPYRERLPRTGAATDQEGQPGTHHAGEQLRGADRHRA